MRCPIALLQVNPAGDFVYTSTSATPIDDSFKYAATGAVLLQMQPTLHPTWLHLLCKVRNIYVRVPLLLQVSHSHCCTHTLH